MVQFLDLFLNYVGPKISLKVRQLLRGCQVLLLTVVIEVLSRAQHRGTTEQSRGTLLMYTCVTLRQEHPQKSMIQIAVRDTHLDCYRDQLKYTVHEMF